MVYPRPQLRILSTTLIFVYFRHCEKLVVVAEASNAPKDAEDGVQDESGAEFSGRVCVYVPRTHTWREKFLVLEHSMVKAYNMSDLHWEQPVQTH